MALASLFVSLNNRVYEFLRSLLRLKRLRKTCQEGNALSHQFLWFSWR